MITEWLTARASSHGTRIPDVDIALAWDPRHPLGVHMTLTTTSGRRTGGWLAARDLLADGLAGAAGLGDIRVHPDGSGLLTRIRLVSPSGSVTLSVETRRLAEFLAATYREVARGAEYPAGRGIPDSADELLALGEMPAGGAS